MHFLIYTEPVRLSYREIRSTQLNADQPVYFSVLPWTTRGATVSLTLTSGSLVCYASDQHHTPELGNADWTFTIIQDYMEVFLYPIRDRPIGSFLVIACSGQQSRNIFSIQVESRGLRTTGTYIT